MTKPKGTTKKAAKAGKPLPRVAVDAKGSVSAHETVEAPLAAEAKTPAKAGKANGKTASKPPREPKEDLVVFAFRLTPAERDAIHAFAGPARASRFVRMLAVAATMKDHDGLQKILDAVGAAK